MTTTIPIPVRRRPTHRRPRTTGPRWRWFYDTFIDSKCLESTSRRRYRSAEVGLRLSTCRVLSLTHLRPRTIRGRACDVTFGILRGCGSAVLHWKRHFVWYPQRDWNERYTCNLFTKTTVIASATTQSGGSALSVPAG